jgi:hypothetical protein
VLLRARRIRRKSIVFDISSFHSSGFSAGFTGDKSIISVTLGVPNLLGAST